MIKHLLLALSLFTTTVYSQNLNGKITRVIDAENILFETRDSAFSVYLYGIDAPEIGQTFYEQTISYLEAFLWADASIQPIKNINQEGVSAFLFIRGKNINVEMVKNGYAWHNKRHSVNAELAWAQLHARDKNKGLWAEDRPTPPWEFKEGVLPKPPPTDGQIRVLICTRENEDRYHKKYCKDLNKCRKNVIVILRKQAKDLNMKACRHCF